MRASTPKTLYLISLRNPDLIRTPVRPGIEGYRLWNMLDVLTAARERLCDSQAPQKVAVATIIAAEGSVPRPIGTSMLVDAAGTVHGSLTGGCVEGAVLDACLQALRTGVATVQRFGYNDEDAFAVGLMCGGTIEVLVQPLRADDRTLLHTEETVPIAMVSRLPSAGCEQATSAVAIRQKDLEAGDDALGRALAPLVPHCVRESAGHRVAVMIRSGRTGTVRLAPPAGDNAPPAGDEAPIELFIETRTPPAHLVIFGANAFGQALVEAARPLGHRITLCDPRPAFTDPMSFPGAEVVRAWPHRYLTEASETGEIDERSMICVLTHDPKVDIPVLTVALGLDVEYVGAMGSRRSDHDRRTALREAGVGNAALARLHSPIGLGLGTLTPAEVAVSILAEILAVHSGHTEIMPLSRAQNPRR